MANFKALYINSKKEKPPYLRDEDFYFFDQDKVGPIDPDTCATIVKLLNQLPPWSLGSLNIGVTKRDAAKGRAIPPYLFQSRGVVLINPSLDKDNKWIEIGAAVVRDGDLRGKWVKVFDPEDDSYYIVEVPSDFKGVDYRCAWRLAPS